MVASWIIPGLGAAFVTAWTYHSGKFLGLPTLKHEYGIPTAIGLVVLAAYMHKKDSMNIVVLPGVPHISRSYASSTGYANTAPSREPLGYLTGPGLDDLAKGTPSSSIVDFPDNVARKQTGL